MQSKMLEDYLQLVVFVTSSYATDSDFGRWTVSITVCLLVRRERERTNMQSKHSDVVTCLPIFDEGMFRNVTKVVRERLKQVELS